MKAAIIAAGLGERLQTAGINIPKPLVPVAGRPLIDYALGAVHDAGIRQVACIVNQIHSGIEEHCRSAWPSLHFEFIRRTTPSSMESLFALAPLLDQRFVLLTVDSIFAPGVLDEFLADAGASGADGVLAVTDHVDDEKPLWARFDDTGRITALGASAAGSGWITAGVYVFEPRVFAEIEAARAAGCNALRQFLGHLLACGYRLDAAAIGTSLDVDRPADLAAAERFVAGFARRGAS